MVAHGIWLPKQTPQILLVLFNMLRDLELSLPLLCSNPMVVIDGWTQSFEQLLLVPRCSYFPVYKSILLYDFSAAAGLQERASH
jgi:hypothetical protein